MTRTQLWTISFAITLITFIGTIYYSMSEEGLTIWRLLLIGFGLLMAYAWKPKRGDDPYGVNED